MKKPVRLNKYGESLFVAKNETEALIHRLRRQIIVHSYIYYKLNDSIWTDDFWQKQANRLRDIQKIYGDEIGFYDKDFKEWDGSTGMHLSQEPWVLHRANRLLDYASKKGNLK